MNGRTCIVFCCLVIAFTVYLISAPGIFLFDILNMDPLPLIYPTEWFEKVLRFYVPDILAAIAVCQSVLLMHEKKFPGFFGYALLFLLLFFELLQILPGLPGTFDFIDILIYFIIATIFFHPKIKKVCTGLSKRLSVRA